MVEARRVAGRDGAVRRWDQLVAWVERRLAPVEERIVEVGGGMSAHWRLVAVELMVAGLLVAATMGDSTMGRGVAAAGFLAGLVLVAVRDRREAVVWLVVWLVCLGTTRRVVSLFQLDPARDPLLVVGPLVAVVVTARSLANGALRKLTILHGLVAAMALVVLLGALNPRQSTVGSAAAGVLIWGGPLLYFWIGRAMTVADMGRVGRVAVGLGIAAALYGIAQLIIGLPPWDFDWVESRTSGTRGGRYASLYIGGSTVRPFGMSTSAAGYAVFMGMLSAVVAAKAAWDWHRLHTRSALVWSSAACLGLAALVLSAVRSVLLLTVLAVFVVVVVARGWSLTKSLLILVMAGMALSLALSQVDPSSLDRDGVEGSVRRVVVLVGDPLSDNYENTTSGHVRSIRGGIEQGFREPLGSGPGSVGLAGSRFGDGGRNSESSISNAGIAFGVLGIAIVGAVMLVGPWTAWRARSVPTRGPTDPAPVFVLAVLGISIVTIRGGFNGEQWAVTPLLWLGLGWVDARAAGLNGPRRVARNAEPARAVPATSRL
jgi:hypothetical protein